MQLAVQGGHFDFEDDWWNMSCSFGKTAAAELQGGFSALILASYQRWAPETQDGSWSTSALWPCNIFPKLTEKTLSLYTVLHIHFSFNKGKQKLQLLEYKIWKLLSVRNEGQLCHTRFKTEVFIIHQDQNPLYFPSNCSSYFSSFFLDLSSG